uniref:Uncharacterized protein n=1 Tax=Zonotrichia albicollis TaxID=44394 RepID=A0A8D2M0Y3_ZONAL
VETGSVLWPFLLLCPFLLMHSLRADNSGKARASHYFQLCSHSGQITGHKQELFMSKRDFYTAPSQPSDGEGKKEAAQMLSLVLCISREKQLNGDMRTCLASQGNSLFYVYLACVDI